MFFEFILYGLLAGVGIALMAGPLGCFIVWRKMAYFGDTLAHSALLGVALSLMLEVNMTATVLVVSFGLAVLLVGFESEKNLATDTLLGILSHSSLALGMIVIALMHGIRVDLFGYLFGDILAVGFDDIVLIYIAVAVIAAVLCLYWRQFLAITVHEELAKIEGQPVKRLRLCLMVLIAWVIALSMKIVGILLITSLLIIPAATARAFAKTPGQMASIASVIGALVVCCGMFASVTWDVPTGPAIVVSASTLFVLTRLIRHSS